MTRYTKRIALITTSPELTKEVEGIIVKALEKKAYTSALADINISVVRKFGCKVVPIANVLRKETFMEFAREFGEVSPLVGAFVEYEDTLEEIKALDTTIGFVTISSSGGAVILSRTI